MDYTLNSSGFLKNKLIGKDNKWNTTIQIYKNKEFSIKEKYETGTT
jgi:hypothetical protein